MSFIEDWRADITRGCWPFTCYKAVFRNWEPSAFFISRHTACKRLVNVFFVYMFAKLNDSRFHWFALVVNVETDRARRSRRPSGSWCTDRKTVEIRPATSQLTFVAINVTDRATTKRKWPSRPQPSNGENVIAYEREVTLKRAAATTEARTREQFQICGETSGSR